LPSKGQSHSAGFVTSRTVPDRSDGLAGGFSKSSNINSNGNSQPMDQNRFMELQYETLRKEIEYSKERVFKIVAGEAFVVPAAQFVSIASDSGSFIKLILPFLVMILVLRFLYENNCIFRSGFYIRKYIEPCLKPKIDQVVGWEEWLESDIELDNNKKCSPRNVEVFAKNGFYVLSFVYYAISVYLAWDYLLKKYPDTDLMSLNPANIALIVYFVITLYIIIGIYISLQLRKCRTSTKA
jgi:hypothetical protein